MAESKDVATREDAAIREALIKGEDLPTVEDTLDVQRAIVERILSAETIEAVFEQAGTTPWQDLIGRPVVVRDVRYLRSSFEQGAPVFAVVEAADPETGELSILSCGGMNVMAQLLKLKQLGALPQTVRLTESPRETAQGYRPLWLEKV